MEDLSFKVGFEKEETLDGRRNTSPPIG